MAAPPFSLPYPASHSPHVSTTVCPAIYAIAIAAIGQVISTAPVAAAAPATAVTPSLRLVTLSMTFDISNHSFLPSIWAR